AMAWAPPPVVWGEVILPGAKLVLLAAALGTGLGLHLYLKCGRWGRALMAWGRGDAPVWIVGVDPGVLGRRAAAMGFAVSALAGGFLALSYTVSIREGLAMTVRVLVLAVLGGTLSPLAVLGLGLGLGVGEAWVADALGMRWGPALGYGLLLFLLPATAGRRS
ncbi:MAG: hypothetical protein K9M82_08260, partial [Deltaproteobacteria bacterium]|nr:hypothetical protein [Deltaproteobacteria bacterium]